MDKKDSIIVFIIILILIIAGVYFWTKPDVAGNQQTSANYEIQGMKVEILQQGSGQPAKSGDKVTVNYVGTLENGTKFDSSVDRGTPFEFTLGQNSVIQGWELGVLDMKVGEKRKLTIPPELAYGEQAVGGVIPANSTLVFEIEMLGINN